MEDTRANLECAEGGEEVKTQPTISEQTAGGLELEVKLLLDTAVFPGRQTAGSAGYDLSAAVEGTVPAYSRLLIRTGLAIRLPEGTYGRIADRSSMRMIGLTVGGVIDPDYCGEVLVIMHNHSSRDFEFQPGTRIAQLILERFVIAPVVVLEATGKRKMLEPTRKRVYGGFGSTGI